MQQNITAEISIIIAADRKLVWAALVNPDLVKEYFFGTILSTTWEPGAPIIFSGQWKGTEYTGKGIVLAYSENEMLQYTYWSSRSGLDDKPENYAPVTYRIGGEDGSVTVTIIQEDIPDLKEREHSIAYWEEILKGLKQLLEANKV